MRKKEKKKDEEKFFLKKGLGAGKEFSQDECKAYKSRDRAERRGSLVCATVPIFAARFLNVWNPV